MLGLLLHFNYVLLQVITSGDFASGCLHAVGFVGVIAGVGCCCLGLLSAYGEPSESVVRGEVGSSRPPIMRPGTAPGRVAAAGVASCTRRAIRVRRQWRGWQLAPANYATRDSTRAGSIR